MVDKNSACHIPGRIERNRTDGSPLLRRLSVVAATVWYAALACGCEKTNGEVGAGPTSPVRTLPSDADHSIGWIHGTCLGIRNDAVKPGTPIQVVTLEKPQAMFEAKIKGAIASSDSGCYALLSERAVINRQDGRFFYRLDINNDTLKTMAIGVIKPTVTVKQGHRGVEFDLNRDGIVEYAQTCLTAEGVQFFISSKDKFDDKALWSDYYYLGYDNEPTCPS